MADFKNVSWTRKVERISLLALVLALIVAVLTVSAIDYRTQRAEDCDRHGMVYDWDLDVCVKGEEK